MERNQQEGRRGGKPKIWWGTDELDRGRGEEKCKVVVIRLVALVFFQAEDGIRDIGVTGVQTCALPISAARRRPQPGQGRSRLVGRADARAIRAGAHQLGDPLPPGAAFLSRPGQRLRVPGRSEERRVGKECRSRWSPYH